MSHLYGSLQQEKVMALIILTLLFFLCCWAFVNQTRGDNWARYRLAGAICGFSALVTSLIISIIQMYLVGDGAFRAHHSAHWFYVDVNIFLLSGWLGALVADFLRKPIFGVCAAAVRSIVSRGKAVRVRIAKTRQINRQERSVRRLTRNERKYKRYLAERLTALFEEFDEAPALWTGFRVRIRALCNRSDGDDVVSILFRHREWLENKISKYRRNTVELDGVSVVAHEQSSVDELVAQVRHIDEILYEIFQFVRNNVGDAIAVNARVRMGNQDLDEAMDRLIGRELDQLTERVNLIVGGLIRQMEAQPESAERRNAMQELAELVGSLRDTGTDLRPVSALITGEHPTVSDQNPRAAHARRKTS